MPPMETAIETESQTRVGVNRLANYGLLAVLVAVIANAPVMHVVSAVPIVGVLTRVPSTAAEEGTS